MNTSTLGEHIGRMPDARSSVSSGKANTTTVNAGFNQLENHVRRGVEQMEPIRFRWLVFYLITWLVGLGGGASTLAAFSLAKETPIAGWIVVGVVLLAFLILKAIVSRQRERLHSIFDAWRAEGVQLLDQTARFSVDQGLASADFDNSGLNGAYYNTYASSHFLAVGAIRSSALAVKNIYTETYDVTETYTDAQGNSHTRTVRKERTVVVPIFHGMLLVIPAKLPHAAWVVLRHRDAGVPNGVYQLKVASPHLTKNYAVGTSDQFAGHRALTPSLMEALWDYRKKFKCLPGYSYRNGLLYLTIPDHWLNYGQQPGKWLAVTTARLDRVLKACNQSIEFLKATSANLTPN